MVDFSRGKTKLSIKGVTEVSFRCVVKVVRATHCICMSCLCHCTLLKLVSDMLLRWYQQHGVSVCHFMPWHFTEFSFRHTDKVVPATHRVSVSLCRGTLLKLGSDMWLRWCQKHTLSICHFMPLHFTGDKIYDNMPNSCNY